jgi:glycosyltransferase involved in cell wall biosynthesis
MSKTSDVRTLVVNFNSPELNQLAAALAGADRLEAFVRPYVNKGRTWERALSALPWGGETYRKTFGRRRVGDARLCAVTREAGVVPDVCAAALGRLAFLPPSLRRAGTNWLYMQVREAVARAACRHVDRVDCIVAYEGFALPAFETMRRTGAGRAILNYPVAHHRHRRRKRLEEIEREPLFASTWPDFDDWPAGHEERLDEEVRLAHGVLVGSTYAARSFIDEGIDAAKMQIVPYGVDLNTFRPVPTATPRERNSFEVIYAGQLTQRKGLSYLLRGYRKFARLDSRLTLAGSLVGEPRVLQPYAKYIRHLPHQTRAAMAELYRQSDVFVFPTLVEGMPLVVLEAMACGLPVIVTGNGPADIVRDGIDGFIIPERDDDAVSACLERLYRDPNLRAEMACNAALRAREFSWDAYTSGARRVLSGLTPIHPPAAGLTACA